MLCIIGKEKDLGNINSIEASKYFFYAFSNSPLSINETSHDFSEHTQDSNSFFHLFNFKSAKNTSRYSKLYRVGEDYPTDRKT